MDINEMLLENNLEGSPFFNNPSFKSAIIGYTEEGSVVYKYNLMVEDLMKEENMEELEAIEFIDYNTMRTIPYMPDPKPVIVFDFIY